MTPSRSTGAAVSWPSPDASFHGVLVVRTGAAACASARTPFDQLGDYVPWTAVTIAALAARSRLVEGVLADAGGSQADHEDAVEAGAGELTATR